MKWEVSGSVCAISVFTKMKRIVHNTQKNLLECTVQENGRLFLRNMAVSSIWDNVGGGKNDSSCRIDVKRCLTPTNLVDVHEQGKKNLNGKEERVRF